MQRLRGPCPSTPVPSGGASAHLCSQPSRGRGPLLRPFPVYQPRFSEHCGSWHEFSAYRSAHGRHHLGLRLGGFRQDLAESLGPTRDTYLR
eukprot:989606-Lingulodinium_polyedra.AAC.1